MRTWSRPLLNVPPKAGPGEVMVHQICTCQKFRKRINAQDIQAPNDSLSEIKDTTSAGISSPLKSLKQQDAERVDSQNRISQTDFKMRILTKKKVTVVSQMGTKPPKHNAHQSASMISSKDDPEPYKSPLEPLDTSAKSIVANA